MLPPPPPLPVLVRTFPYNCPYFSVLVRTFCYFSVLDYKFYSSSGEGVRAADSQFTGPEIDPGRNLVLYSAGRGRGGGARYVLFRTCPYFSVLVRTRLRNNNRQHKTFRNMVRKKSWEYSVSLELFSSTLRTILRKTRILLGQCSLDVWTG